MKKVEDCIISHESSKQHLTRSWQFVILKNGRSPLAVNKNIVFNTDNEAMLIKMSSVYNLKGEFYCGGLKT